MGLSETRIRELAYLAQALAAIRDVRRATWSRVPVDDDDRKGRNEMWAGPVSWHFGAELSKSTDMGKTWDAPEKLRIKMPKTSKKSKPRSRV